MDRLARAQFPGGILISYRPRPKDMTLLTEQALQALADGAETLFQEHTLTVNANSGYDTSSPEGIDCGLNCSETYAYGTAVALTATANTNFTFIGWSGACSSTADCVITMDEEKGVSANFTLDKHTLTVSTNGTGSGSFFSTPDGIDCGLDCSEVYDYGTVVTLTAVADTGSTFTGCGGACSGINDCVVSISESQNVTATFSKYYIFLPVVVSDH